MSSVTQGFPDDRDRELQRQADKICNGADELVEWAGKFVKQREPTDYRVGPEEEFSLYRLRRLASNLWRSANVPVAAAVYGASQVGKSLFIGRVLETPPDADSPLGKCDRLGPPSYVRELSFHHDINPQCGANEATALVTRFTTKERFDEKALPEYPVKVRALSRAEWLRVLARGFRSECRQPTNVTWREGQVRELFEEVSRDHADHSIDRDWRMDLLDVYAYLRGIDPRQYEISESMFNSFLSQYPLSEAGCVEIAGRMFWDRKNFPALTTLFNNVCRFLKRITSQGRDGILCHWAAVKFLLDSQRASVQESPLSRWHQRVDWQDISASFNNGWYVLDYKKPGTEKMEDLAIIQSALLEMIIPVVPHRLKVDWRDVILRMDLLDLPGMRAGGSDTQGGAASIDTIPEMMNVVKRGKVFYLIDRYLEERQVQTFLLLIRGGLLEVRQLLKEYIDKWGKARYGDDAWPTRLKVDTPDPALFIGLTGIDDEFEKRVLNRNLYDNRLNQLVNETLYEVMTDFGGPGQPFTNVYPIRYPGTWDADEARRKASGEPQKWEEAGEIFVASPMVVRHVRNAREKWQVAMRDDDGGLSLISKGFVGCTTSLQKQDALDQQIKKVRQDLKNLAEPWYCNPDVNNDRAKRISAAKEVLKWLAEDEERVFDRVHALQNALCFEEGDAMKLAEFPEVRAARPGTRPQPLEQRFLPFLKEFLTTWSRELAVNRWTDQTAQHDAGAPGLPLDRFSEFSRYLGEYLCCDGVFGELSQRLMNVLTLAMLDEGDRRHARREYVRVILNDFVMNPGPSDAPLETVPLPEDRDYGLMESFVARWYNRLPLALASAAGAAVKIPPGNDEIRRILDRF